MPAQRIYTHQSGPQSTTDIAGFPSPTSHALQHNTPTHSLAHLPLPTKKASSPQEKHEQVRAKPLYTQYVWEVDIRDSFPSNPLEVVLIRGPTVALR